MSIHGVEALGTETGTMEPPHRRSPGWQVPVTEADPSLDGVLRASQRSQFQKEPGRTARARVASCLWFVCSGSSPQAGSTGPHGYLQKVFGGTSFLSPVFSF